MQAHGIGVAELQRGSIEFLVWQMAIDAIDQSCTRTWVDMFRVKKLAILLSNLRRRCWQRNVSQNQVKQVAAAVRSGG